MNNNTMQNKKRKGFTLFEMLIVVAIMVALFAVSAVSVNSIQKSIRQKKLDYCAELIYMAAQNQITELCVAGDGCYLPETKTGEENKECDALALGYKPEGAGAGADEDTYYYVCSWYGENQTAQKLVPEGLIDETIRSGNWVIEYDPLSACVFAVFYSEGDRALEYSRTDVDFTTALRVKKARLADGAQIGYYGGDSEYNPNYNEMEPKIEVYNGEALVAYVSCVSVDGSPVSFELTVSQKGRSETIEVENGTPMGNVYQATVELDSFSNSGSQDRRFSQQFSGLIPGEDITVTVTAHSSNLLIEDASKTAETDVSGNAINSLFAAVNADDGIAYISCARHLQNLDVNTSFVGTEGDAGTTQITKAVQTGDISFLDDGITQSRSYMEDWATYYKTSGGSCRKFSPIHNSQLQSYDGSYDGQNYSITGLQTSALATENAGLFAELSETTVLQNISLVSTKIAQGLNVGSLVGSISGTAYIVNCSSVLDARTDINTKYDSNLALGTNGCWIKGSPAGGLVGAVGNGAEVKIVNSYAATVVGTSASAYAGGLVGINRGTLEITGCYADCYLNGRNTAGLVGFNTAVATLKLQSCYTAGYQTATTRAAGLCNGTIASANNVYSACCYQGMKEGVPVYGDATAVADEENSHNVYYLSSETITKNSGCGEAVNSNQFTGKDPMEKGTEVYLTDKMNALPEGTAKSITLPDNSIVKLCTKFVASPTVSTVAYNLLGQGLSNYTFPSFEGVAHYGDWLAAFDEGQLVYWEQYEDKSYGFYGANANTLQNDQMIIGDGYGLVYEKDKDSIEKEVPTANLYVAVDYETVSGVTTSTAIQLTGTDSALQEGVLISSEYVEYEDSSYYILQLPKDISDRYLTLKNETQEIYETVTAENYWHKLGVFVVEQGQGGGLHCTNEFYYNPHFSKSAMTPVIDSAGNKTYPAVPTVIAVRSARQLYDLSVFYEAYANVTKNVLFQQELDIDYTIYDWKNCTKNGKEVKEQGSIGGRKINNSDVAFVATYDGNYCTITGVSFASKKYSAYTGMFGLNTGTLKNIRLCANPEKSYGATFNGGVYGQSEDTDYGSYYAGILAGRNLGGTIDNCALAGYSVTVGASSNSALYAGALVGGNEGTVRNSAVSFPKILITNQNATIRAGGFCGWNGGSINACYAMGTIQLGSNQDGTVELAGFCATNKIEGSGISGSSVSILQNCYCATAITYEGTVDKVNAFCPAKENGSSCKECYYLNSGNFRYLGQVHTLDYKGEDAKGVTALNYNSLRKLSLTGFGAAAFVNDAYYNTAEDGSTENFPFPAVVKDADGRFVQYGDWYKSAITDTSGIYYWEHEVFYDSEGNTTGEDQYRIAFVGDNSNLCTNHDDGGVIVEYGYGYFVTDDYAGVSLAMSGFRNGAEIANIKNKATYENEDANAALKSLMLDYTFHSYTSYCPEAAGVYAATDINSSLLLSGSDQNGTWTLTDNGTVTTYSVCPYFGAAMSKQGEAEPGTKTNPYLVRSTVQLQYINWNYDKQNCKTAVTKDNRTLYPYLQYATVTGQNMQTREDAEKARKPQYWSQSHDIGVNNKDISFYPIAGTYTGSTEYSGYLASYGDFDAKLYTWFGGSYDGQSYKMLNLAMTSDLNNIGVFGYTCSAELKNIQLYSDKNTLISRSATSNEHSYSIGSLVGIAYMYQTGETQKTISNCCVAGYRIEDNSKNTRLTTGDVNIGGLFGIADADITNCSAVVDLVVNCTFEYFSSYSNIVRVGGVAGCCPYKLENCYSGGSISLGDDMNKAIKGGSGATRPTSKLLYNVVGFDTDNGNFYDTYVYVAGICPGYFAGNFQNFTNNYGMSHYYGTFGAGVDLGRSIYNKTIIQTFENCYTYMEMNVSESVSSYRDNNYKTCYIGVYSVMAIGGVPERTIGEIDSDDWLFYNSTGHTTITNCWYLNTIVPAGMQDSYSASAHDNIPWNEYFLGAREKYEKNTKLDASDVVNGGGACTWSEMTNGTLGGWLNSPKLETAAQRKEAYEAEDVAEEPVEAGTITNYAPVTTRENYNGEESLIVNGKYSFPGNNPTLSGTNYPFPTIVTRINEFNETVHIHYGEWPEGTLMFRNYYNELNILEKRDVALTLLLDGDATGKQITLSFYNDKDQRMTKTELEAILVPADNGGFTIGESDGYAVVYYTPGSKEVEFRFTAKNTGIVKVEAKVESYTASCQLSIAGHLDVTAKALSPSGGYFGYKGDVAVVGFEATYSYLDENGNEKTVTANADNITWGDVDLKGYTAVLEKYYTQEELDNAGMSEDEEPQQLYPEDIRDVTVGGETLAGTRLKFVGAGQAVITVSATYTTDDGIEVKGNCNVVLEGWEANTVGLADTTGSQYTEITHQAPVAEEPYHSYSNLTETGQISYARYDAGAAPKAEGYDLLVYAKGTGFDLEAFMENATITVTKDNGAGEYVEAVAGDYVLTPCEVQDVNGWDVAPLLFQCKGGKYQITITSQCGVKYLENGAEASAARTAGYTITLTYERETTEYTVDLYGYTNTSDIADGLAQKMGSLTVKYPELTVTAQNATDNATLPTYYEYVTDGQWQTWDALSQTVMPIGEGLTVSGNMALYRPIQGMEYTITLQHGDRTRTVKLIYGSTDSTIPASMDLTYYGEGSILPQDKYVDEEGIERGYMYLFAQSEILDHWKGCDKDGTGFTLQDADELLAVMKAFEGVAEKDRILTAVLYDPSAENSLMQSYLAEAPEETLETESVSEESKEQETETRTTGE